MNEEGQEKKENRIRRLTSIVYWAQRDFYKPHGFTCKRNER